MNVGFKSSLELFIEAFTLVIMFVGIALGVEKSYVFFVITILGLAFFYLYKRNRRKKAIREYKEEIKSLWGKERIEKRNFSEIKKLNTLLVELKEPYFHIDDTTWSDLNMDTIFSKVDHTMSLMGMEVLYYILRSPLFEEQILQDRNQVINSLGTDKSLSHEIQYYISLLGKDKGKEMADYFKEGINIETKHLLKYRVLSFLPILGIILLFVNVKLGFLMLLITIPTNGLIHSSHSNKASLETERFKYIGNLIHCTENILKLNTEDIDLQQGRIREILEETKGIKKNVSKISSASSFRTEVQILVDGFNMVFLREPVAFYKTVDLLNTHKKKLLELYILVGKIDAYISIASYKSGLDFYTRAELLENGSGFYMKAEELYHPLLEDPIPYSFELDNNGILVTGSNASGKSTFLRAIGINALFAQTFYISLAKSYKASYFKLLTSIGTIDDIVEGDSYFMVEAKSLKRIIDSLNPEEPVLCILDEIFKGTNTAERISAANQSLDYMSTRNACVVLATHDLELVNLVDKGYKNYHFRERMGTEDIEFDYKLRKGPSTTRNAIAILENLGYPDEIYEKARVQAREYLKE